MNTRNNFKDIRLLLSHLTTVKFQETLILVEEPDVTLGILKHCRYNPLLPREGG